MLATAAMDAISSVPVLKEKRSASVDSVVNEKLAASDSEFVKKDEPATLPRVQQLYIISDLAPWCTTVHNDAGVTLENICRALFQQ